MVRDPVMTRRPEVERRTLLVLGSVFIVIVASALAWNFCETGRGPAFLVLSVEIERTNRETVPLYGLLEADLMVERHCCKGLHDRAVEEMRVCGLEAAVLICSNL